MMRIRVAVSGIPPDALLPARLREGRQGAGGCVGTGLEQGQVTTNSWRTSVREVECGQGCRLRGGGRSDT